MRAIVKNEVATLEHEGVTYRFAVRPVKTQFVVNLFNEAIYGDPSPETAEFCRTLAKLYPAMLPIDQFGGDLVMTVGSGLKAIRYTTEECLLLSN